MKNDDKGKSSRKALIKLPFLALIPLGLWLPSCAPKHTDAIEAVYGAKIYPVIAEAIGFISSAAAGVSLAECIIAALVIAAAALLIIGLVRLILRRGTVLGFVNFLLSLGIFAGVMIILFYAVWGFNYTREPLKDRMQLDVCQRPVSELEELSAYLADEAAKYRAMVPEDADGVFEYGGELEECFADVAACYDDLGGTIGTAYNAIYPAKPVFMSSAMSYAGISGIFIPYTCECNVNVDQPWLLIPAAAAHENAHSAGIAPENEADFVGVLACLESDDEAVVYSGLMSALIHCTNRLYAADNEAYYRVRERYIDGMIRDLQNYNLYWSSFDGPVEETMDSVNDNYLRHNRQPSGISSYGEMVDLMLAWYYK